MGRAPLSPAEAPVPYLTVRRGEVQDRPTVVYTMNGPASVGIGYADEVEEDRDARDVLWERVSECPDGAPRYRYAHPERQAAAMDDLRCQVFFTEADWTEQGVLFLLSDVRGEEETPAGWPEGAVTLHPPLSLEGAAWSVLACGHLADGWVAVRVTDPDPEYGYCGTLYQPSPAGPVPVPRAKASTIPYNHPLVGWLVASAQAAVLRGCTVVDLAAELAAAGHAELAERVAAAYPEVPV
ncbi:hypothetical protein ACFYNO_15080 [Kitasatospora sp. NPDC006697]|uniref:hypothetical protein n=1 Tax=unclassified Kitasatospora TaxID=2633591 RepID=UPI00367A0A8B